MTPRETIKLLFHLCGVALGGIAAFVLTEGGVMPIDERVENIVLRTQLKAVRLEEAKLDR